ncbi:MAG: hybrid sensor histidine kinase/response regulator [Verrucomicrobiota bacterium]|nr:hybrid sensor histidine kinase/response regulator [Verrucomicrobiota bacterium]
MSGKHLFQPPLRFLAIRENMTILPEMPQILVIDDEMGPRESLRMLLKPNYQVHTAESVEAGIRLLREKRPDAIISDIRMPGATGIEGLRRIREIDPHVSVIMLTGFGALETAQEALRLGANDYISKPFDAKEMRDVISRNVERTRLARSGQHAAEEITELNARLVKELAQKERLASLGQASAEFVHDLGNPLTIVWGYVQLLAKKLEQQEKGGDTAAGTTSAKELNIIEQNVRLCRELLTMWQSYGSGEASPHKQVSVCATVRELIKGLSSIATQNGVKLTSDIAEDPCAVLGNSVQVTRAIQNVIVNAIQAAGETKGEVGVSCERKEFYVDVRVRDTGPGMSADQLQKIFEPYFTTKQNKSGTGLGLYITKKVVEDHNGSIKVESVQGTGTTMTIRLPLANK